MITPHWYQSDCLRALRRSREKTKKEALIVMASGLGKTETSAWDTLEFLKQKPGARVLFLAHQADILRKARTTFEAIHGSALVYDFCFSKHKPTKKPQFLFAMLQTMRKACKNFDPTEFDYVIVDESHHTHAETFLDVVQYWKPEFLMGMTATPDRTDGQDICKVFGQPVFYLPIEEALAQELLTPVDYRVLTDEIHFPKLAAMPEKRWSIRQLNRRIFVPKRDQEIARIIAKHLKEIEKPQMIVFCESVAHCNHLSQFLPNSLPYHSKIPAAERIVRLEMFRNGDVSTLLSVDVFNEGVDVPQANVLVFLRSTSSPMIFLQQLGRGLRVTEGKEKVVVLDFVANCERIKTVYELWKSVKERREFFLSRPSKGLPGVRKRTSREKTEPFVVDGGQVEFHEKIVHLMNVVRRITDGFSKDEALQSLKDFAQKLGRSPTQLEVHFNRDLPSTSFYQKNFGTFGEALTAAGLIPNRFDNVSETDLLEQLKKLAVELKHTPTQDEVAAASMAGKCSSEPVFRKHFGSLVVALAQIGFTSKRQVGLSKEALCMQLRNLKTKLSRIPRVDDLKVSSASGETASYTAFRLRFKTWQLALKAAGLIEEVREVKRYAGTELIEDLLMAREILGRVPSSGDISRLQKRKKLNTVSLGPFYTTFGSFPEALKAAGITK